MQDRTEFELRRREKIRAQKYSEKKELSELEGFTVESKPSEPVKGSGKLLFDETGKFIGVAH